MIAIDLDNTIIRYDRAFEAAAARLQCLPFGGPINNKATVKSAAFAAGGNDLWTRLQGLAYGEEIARAEIFPGCVEFFAAAREELVIVSHKTRFPALGQPADLREAARAFLASTPLAGTPVFFLDTREAKVAKLAELRPRAFIDDLPEVLQTPGFPPATAFHLFDPDNNHPVWTTTPRVRSWLEAARILLPE
jgi:hypothetical protein